jgi:carbamoylphosphate synthase small subunit
MRAVLALENGQVYEGVAAGATGEATGEVVFNTSMTGYQEVLTDPSYAGQIVTMTAPQIGNYGVTDDDEESRGVQVAGFVMREASPIASNWRADGTLRDYLVRNNIVAIAEIDTRALTRVLRETGVMRGVIAAGNDLSPKALVDRARQAANHPVKHLESGQVEITAQNHGFAVDAASLPKDVEITHLNLNDNTVEGFRHRERPVFCVQYHPEASPGPHDADYLFRQFLDEIEKRK